MGSEAGRNVWINVFWGRRQPFDIPFRNLGRI